MGVLWGWDYALKYTQYLFVTNIQLLYDHWQFFLCEQAILKNWFWLWILEVGTYLSLQTKIIMLGCILLFILMNKGLAPENTISEMVVRVHLVFSSGLIAEDLTCYMNWIVWESECKPKSHYSQLEANTELLLQELFKFIHL